MTKFIYDENGFAVGFELGPYIFDMNMNPGNVSAQIYSGNVGSSGNPGKRGPVICEYPDVFYKLLK